MIRKLHAVLAEIATRRQRQRLHGGLAIAWWSGLLSGALLLANGVPARTLVLTLLPILLAASFAVWIWSRRGLGDPRLVAKLVEAKHPELETALLAALDQKPGDEPLNYLQLRLIVESVAAAERDQWIDLVPKPRLDRLRVLNLAAVSLALIALAIALFPRRATESTAVAGIETPPTAALEFEVDPGDVELERGSPLTIQARFGDNTPAEASLELTDEAGLVRTLPLTRPFTDPVYQARLSAVPVPLSYRVVTSGGNSRAYQVTVFDRPALVSSLAVLTFPEHLGKPPQTIKDPRSVQVPERTRMEFSLVANLPGLSVSLLEKDSDPLALTTDPVDPARHLVTLDLTRSIRYEIVLTDRAGRRNPRKELLDIKVLPNKAPVVKVVLPRKNEKATPIQEVRLEAKITDDSGLLAQGLRYTLDGKAWTEIETPVANGAKLPPLSHLIDLEAAGAKPKDILMWNAWAEDTGPDGRKRRVNGDIHIVRVRDFDEEFYQQAAPPGEAPPAGAEAAAEAGAELIKTQTQILNATWSLRRDHAEITDTPPDSKDLETLRRSQEIAIETAAGLEEQQTDPAVRQFLTDARLAMKDALAELTSAREKSSAAPLESAITHEQVALRHLYQLMSSTTMLMTGQNASGEPSESSEDVPRDELDLKPMDTPYQAEKQAQPESPAGTESEAGEAMEILKRLDELAKRQRDLNEEMQALQNALDEAATPEDKAAVERQLKQLREQQREMLADVDELRERTNDPAQQATEARQNEALDDAREKAQQANEQLNENKLGEALAAGRRAQESLEELHEDFRETSAARLAEQLRELRQDARALEERQRELAEASAADEQPRPERLRDSPEVDAGIAQQREDLQQLLDSMRRTAESAESAEPLVAQDLAEALRQADQNRIAQSLEQMERSGPDSAAAEQAAEGIAGLTREIEGAAERILGNEAQALRYARDELQRLAEQAAGEAGQNAPGEGNEPGQAQGEEQPGAQAGTEPGEGNEPGQAPGEGQPGAQAGNQPGEGNEPGQAPGEGQPGAQAGNQPGEGNEPGQAPGQGQPGAQAGNQPREDNEPGQAPGEGQPGAQAGNQPGEGNEPGQAPGQGQPGAQAGNAPGEGDQPGEGQAGEARQPGQAPGRGQPGEGRQPGQAGGRAQASASGGGGNGRGGSSPDSPITGDGFEEWSDRLYDLEAVVEDPDAQAAVARARQASREMRKDFKRHSVEPGQDQLQKEVVGPLAEAARKIDARLRELDRKDPLAPVGRDPVPDRYNDLVRRYFEELGK